MKNAFNTKSIVITGLLLALEIIFQIIGNYLQIGPANLNVALVPIVLAGVLCGPISGAVLGFFNGIMALLSPSTIAIFMPIDPVGTVMACLLKCTLAGALGGFVFKFFKNKHQLMGLILISLLVPTVNTGIFCIMCLIFFRPFLESGVGNTFPNIGAFLVFGVVGWNFILELLTTAVLSPLIGMILLKREQKGQ